MWTTTQTFLDAVTTSHQFALKVEGWIDGAWTEFEVTAGSVSADYYALTARTFTGDMAPQFSSVLSRVRLDSYSPTIYGAYLRIFRGITYPNGTEEFVPVGVFVIDRYQRDTGGDYGLSISGSDLYSQIIRARMETPRTVSGPSRIEVCKTLIREALEPNLPWGPVVFRTLPGVVDSALQSATIDRDRGAAIRDILAGADLRGYFAPDGAFEFAPSVTVDTPPVWSLAHGENGTLIGLKEALSREKIYNIAVVNGEPPDPETPPVMALARDEDVNSPTYWQGPFGKVPYFYASQFIYTVEQAQAVANSLLLRIRGAASSFGIQTVPNPALQPGDVVNVQYGADDKTDTHMITRMTIPFSAEQEMSLDTQLLSTVGQTVPERHLPGKGMFQ